jgi:hypothetical protein
MADEKDDLELVRGSGNVFADFGAPDASLRQFRAVLAAEIVKTQRRAPGLRRRTSPVFVRLSSTASPSTG